MPDQIKPVIFTDSGFTVDISRAGVQPDDLARIADKVQAAHQEMKAIEDGAVKNPDENRKVTHFTDRADYPASPLFHDVNQFAADVRDGRIVGGTGRRFEYVVFNGIGGSALGPQLVQMAINGPYWNELRAQQRRNYPRVYFLDNTDTAGLADILDVIELPKTLVVTISKSGSTQETKSNMLAFEQVYRDHGLRFPAHAAAITMKDSQLDQYAVANQWLKVWPMADSIGGRTSVTAVVGHVPAALGGVDFGALLAGATTMDAWTRNGEIMSNPAYLLAAVWYLLGNGRGDRNMVILPYSDRLVLLSRYLQQLVMESLGKELDRQGKIVNQGISVFGNKGGTDAHAFVQQLNDGRDDFMVTFLEILKDTETYFIDDKLTMGDSLHNFLHGLIAALHGKNRRVISVTVEELNARTLGMIIALYERAVAFYGELVNVNAFHQPGVQAYKKASLAIDELSSALQGFIAAQSNYTGTAAEVGTVLGRPDRASDIEGILAKYAVNQRVISGRAISRALSDGGWRYQVVAS